MVYGKQGSYVAARARISGATSRASEVRTQIYLPRRLHQALRRAAKARGVSMAQLIREAAEDALRRARPRDEDPLTGLIGIIRDAPPDLAERHDHYLYGPARTER